MSGPTSLPRALANRETTTTGGGRVGGGTGWGAPVKTARRPALALPRLPFFNAGRKPGTADLAHFTRNFATMVAAGVPISRSLEILASQNPNPRFASLLTGVSADVIGGVPLSEALAAHSSTFSPLYCNLITASEASGNLDVTAGRLADHLEKTIALRRKLASAAAYPIILLLLILGVSAFMFTVIVPRFSEIFADFEAELPSATRLVVGLAERFTFYAPAALGIAGLLIFLVYRWNRTPTGRAVIDRIRLGVPVFGILHRKTCITRFTRTLSTLLENGVGILDSCSIAARTAGNALFEKALLMGLEKIAGGENIAGPMEATGFFSPMVIQMIATGEQTGKLPAMLARIAETYEAETESALSLVISLIEPVLIVFMAFLVGSILISLYLPMFQMIGAAG